ncbi:hypothetical protein C8Q74DRAFT_610900 [Fomes fomentarius]|nr:hypothetical protein C8Q74DRAFT_610900 [Fomes fomentarius]
MTVLGSMLPLLVLIQHMSCSRRTCSSTCVPVISSSPQRKQITLGPLTDAFAHAIPCMLVGVRTGWSHAMEPHEAVLHSQLDPQSTSGVTVTSSFNSSGLCLRWMGGYVRRVQRHHHRGVIIGVIGRIQSIGLTASCFGAGELQQVVSVHLTLPDFAAVRGLCF